jgi:hypothetical protein
MKRAFPSLVLAVLAACASAPPSSLYVRSGLTTDQLAADSDRCMAEAYTAETSGPGAPSDGSADSTGMAKGSPDMQRFVTALDACFVRLGYRERRLMPAQQEEFGRLQTEEERAAYIVRLSAEESH